MSRVDERGPAAPEEEAATPEPARPAPPRPGPGPVLEFVAVVVLSITTLLTAWSAFQASQWGGETSIAFSRASADRIEAARAAALANARLTNQIGLWTQWVVAQGSGEPELADFLVARFPEPLATAHGDWLAAGGAAAGAPGSPFEMPSYALPEQQVAADLDAQASEAFDTALTDDQPGDDYTVLTVLFAAVLFFAAMSARVRAARSQWVLLGTAVALGLVGVCLLAAFPKLL
ncbi:hypothetical protein [Geodermatophilus sp. SYSU D01036]